jgi:hypothetical protein
MRQLSPYLHLASALVALSWILLASACGPAALSVKENGPAGSSDADIAGRFDAVFAQNAEAASSHYWHAIDCKNRDEGTGMPTVTLGFPRAIRSYIDSTEYTATHVFRAEEGAQGELIAFVRERFKANLPEGFEHYISEGSEYEQLAHKASPDDFVTVSLSVEPDGLYMTFRPQSKDPIPPGNPCLKPDLAVLTARFDAMKEAVERSDEGLFKAQWHAEGYERNLAGGSGIPGAGVFGQGSKERWVLEPDMKSARNPLDSGDVWIVSCAVVSLVEQRTLDVVWILIADGKVLGGGEDREDVGALAWRWANKAPLAP